jgi:leucine dehydrogenase
MTYKNALAGLNVGGGKAVILGDPKTRKTEVLFRAFGRFVETLGGRYIAAEDVGTDVDGTGVSGNRQRHRHPAWPRRLRRCRPVHRLRHAARLMADQPQARPRKWARSASRYRGWATSAWSCSKLLKERGADLHVSDLDPAKVEQAVTSFGAEAVKPEQIYELPVDVLAPCAAEGVITADVLPRLKAKMICGPANNQLASHAIGDELQRMGILYAPDYAVNAAA